MNLDLRTPLNAILGFSDAAARSCCRSSTTTQRYADTAQLFRAMGGGWRESGDLTPTGSEPKQAVVH